MISIIMIAWLSEQENSLSACVCWKQIFPALFGGRLPLPHHIQPCERETASLHCNRYVGAWRSPVARTVRVGEVVGSNPAAPTLLSLAFRYDMPTSRLMLSGNDAADSKAFCT